jgi:drug/metabolite transporter (DMT)-like permease
VRLSGVGPVAAGFWRTGLAVPFLFLVALLARQPVHWPGRLLTLLVALSGFFFAADLAAWHTGIHLTKLANATLFGNSASLILAVWGLWLAQRRPLPAELLAMVLAVLGVALLMGSSAELSARHFTGDLLCLLAGLLYAAYLIAVQRARVALQPLQLLFIATVFSAFFLFPLSLALGERVIPHDWTWVLLLAIGSQVIGQGLLVYAVGSLSPLIVGVTLLTHPAISALTGWLAYGEKLRAFDWLGATAIGAALGLVRLPERALREAAPQPS